MNGLYTAVLTLFLLLAVGFIARKAGIITEVGSKSLSKLIICVGQPFMIIGMLLDIDYSAENLKSGFIMLALGLAAHTLIAAIAHFAVFRYKNINEKKIAEFSMIFANCGFMGLPILKATLGDIGAFYAAFYIVSFNIVIWTWGMIILGRGRDDIKMNPVKIFLNYGTLPSIIGILIYASQGFGVKIPDVVRNFVSYLGSLCTPVSMLITGGLLATIGLASLRTRAKVLYTALFKLLVIPLAIGTIAYLAGLDNTKIIFLSIMAALPTASNTVMFAELYDIDKEGAAITAGATTFLSMGTLPLVVLIIEKIIGA